MKRQELCRSECLRFLAERLALKHTKEAVRRGVNREGGDFTENEVRDALAFLSNAGLSLTTFNDLGSTLFYQATSAGVLAHERGA